MDIDGLGELPLRAGRSQPAHDDPLFQRPELSELPDITPAPRPEGTSLGTMTRLLATGVLGVAAMVGCGSSGGPDCPTPLPGETQQTCTHNGVHYVFIPGHGWTAPSGQSGVGQGGHPGSTG